MFPLIPLPRGKRTKGVLFTRAVRRVSINSTSQREAYLFSPTESRRNRIVSINSTSQREAYQPSLFHKGLSVLTGL